jgi:uncharacterized protein
MKLDPNEQSSNVEDRRAEGGGSGGNSRGGIGRVGVGGGIGTLVIIVVALFLGVDPSALLQLGQTTQAPQQQTQQTQRAQTSKPAEDQSARFVSGVLRETEKTWGAIFQASGQRYPEPGLVLFRGSSQSACGAADTATGPFYCPADQKIYIDLQFFDDLRSRFKAPGDFAQAYVIAHEVGHHVQTVLGTMQKVEDMRRRTDKVRGNALSVRVELQADCYAGVWAHHADKSRKILEAGDVEEALGAASAIGDDRLQQQAQGRVVPDSFTHGSSEQRVRWFKAGLQSGSLKTCDTFSAQRL